MARRRCKVILLMRCFAHVDAIVVVDVVVADVVVVDVVVVVVDVVGVAPNDVELN